MDAWPAQVEIGRDLARASTSNRKRTRRSTSDRKFPATLARIWARPPILFAVSKARSRHAGSRHNAMHWNVEAGSARTIGRTQHAAESQLLNSPAVSSSI